MTRIMPHSLSRVIRCLALAAAAASLVAPSLARAQQTPSQQASPQHNGPDLPNIPLERFTLPNGLTVVLSPDHSSPIAAVTVWYHVGSKNEVPGRTGFAHLFEHVMFQGSAHAEKGEHIRAIEDAGGTMNGSTENDRTNYYETIPINQLETALWLESDRMGYLLPALTQAKLDNQRDVVKNERRQRVDNQPFGSAGEVFDAALFPATNPYSWPVIGSMADLSAASLDDVKDFFRHYYAPDNATLVIVGDIDPARTRAMVERYFGPIPRGPGIQRPTVALARLSTEKRLVLEDQKATLPRLSIAWPTVGLHSPDAPALDALADVLTLDRTSRLTKLLVYDRQLATSVRAGQDGMEDEGYFSISVTPRPGASLTTIEQVTDSVLAGLITSPPDAREVDRSKHYGLVNTVTSLEAADAKAETLAEGQTYYGDPSHYQVELREAQAVTPADVRRVAQQYLTSGRVVLSMVPAGKLDLVSKASAPYTNVTTVREAATTTAAAAAAAPSAASTAPPSSSPVPPSAVAQGDSHPPRPVAGASPAVRIPAIQVRTLANGIKVAVLENHQLPIVSVTTVVDAPRLLDPAGKEGVSALTAQMMAEGTTSKTADQIAQAEADLGNGVSATGFFTITRNVDGSLALMADQLLHPLFPQASLDRIKSNTIAGIQRQKDQPMYLARRVFANVVYGPGHPYARTETEASVGAITRDDLVAFHRDYYRPRNTTVIVAGDVTPDAIVPKLERAFAEWTGGGKSGEVTVTTPRAPGATQVYLYDRPGSPQSVIVAGQLGPQRDTKDFYALELVNTALGGAFNSRLNLDLREAHGYTYSAQSRFAWRRRPQRSTFQAAAAVATPKTDSALVDFAADMRDIRQAKPVSDSELVFAKRTATLSLPLAFSTVEQEAGAAAELFEYRLPLDYYDHLTANYEGVSLADARAAAQKYLDPSHMAIVVVGDRQAIEPGLQAAHVAPVAVVDLQANPITKTGTTTGR